MLNLAFICGFKSYTAYTSISGFKLSVSKGWERKRIIHDPQDIVFDEEEVFIDKNSLKIPYLTLKELNPMKIIIMKKVSLYDVVRLIAVFILLPIIFLISLFSKDPKKYIPMSIFLVVYIYIIYIMRRFISPIKITIDKLRNTIKVSKLIFSVSFPISQIKQIEITDQLVYRSGTFIFYVDVRLKNDKKHQLFYTEFINKKEKIYEVFENLSLLLNYISKELNILIINQTTKM